MAECPAIIVIDSATYLLTISSPDINKVAMSLYDIINLQMSSFDDVTNLQNYIFRQVNSQICSTM